MKLHLISTLIIIYAVLAAIWIAMSGTVAPYASYALY